MGQIPRNGILNQKIISEPERLDLYSMRDLEYRLGMSRQELREVASNTASYYDPFLLPKPARPFAKKQEKQKSRLIDRPIGPVLDIQDRIYRRLLGDLDVPNYIC